MARFIIENKLERAEDLKAFNSEGYSEVFIFKLKLVQVSVQAMAKCQYVCNFARGQQTEL